MLVVIICRVRLVSPTLRQRSSWRLWALFLFIASVRADRFYDYDSAIRRGGAVPDGPGASACHDRGDGSLFSNVAQNGFAPNPTRIDASITNIFSSLPQAGIVSAATITRPDLAMSLGTLQSVALGATNAGDVILSVAVSRDSALGLADTGTSTDIPSASVIMLGENFVHDARTDLSHIDDLIALSMSTAFESWQSGSSPDATVVVINMAANGSDVSARILTHVEGAVLDARDATATALGAVNVGIAQVIGEP